MASRVARSHANTPPTSPTPTAKQTAAKLQHHEKEKETAARGLARVGCEGEGAKPADEEPERKAAAKQSDHYYCGGRHAEHATSVLCQREHSSEPHRKFLSGTSLL